MRWLSYLNLTLVSLTGLTLGAIFFLCPTEEMPARTITPPENKSFPKSSFTQPEEMYQAIGEDMFSLKWVSPKIQLPDLRRELIFYGKNDRPDTPPGERFFHIGLKESKQTQSVRMDEAVYLVYQQNSLPNVPKQTSRRQTSSHTPIWGETSSSKRGSYFFSSNNQPTSLWFKLHAIDDQKRVQATVSMLDEEGNIIESPSDLKLFLLSAQPFAKSQIRGWKLNAYPVDTTLLVRQKARWIGSDCFLERHGGEEFAFALGRQRIDFLDKETPYSCFVRENDFLVWKEGQWRTPHKGEQTIGSSLMVVKKINEKIMSLEVWDPEGRGKTLLHLIRTQDHNALPDLTLEFKFIGAKTWAQFIVESRGGTRMTLKSNDWILLTQEGWKKIDSTEEIDDYVQQRLTGPLFILDKLAKKKWPTIAYRTSFQCH